MPGDLEISIEDQWGLEGEYRKSLETEVCIEDQWRLGMEQVRLC